VNLENLKEIKRDDVEPSIKPNLVIQTAFLGDAVLTIPLLKWFKRKYPDSPLHFLVRSGYGSFFKDLGLIDKFYEFDKANKKESWSSLSNNILSNNYNLAFCPHRSFRSQGLLKNITADEKVSYLTNYNKNFLTQNIKHTSNEHEVYRLMRLAETIDSNLFSDITEAKISNHTLAEGLPMSINSNFKILIEKHKYLPQTSKEKTIVVSPGSVWPTKKWTREGFKAICKALVLKGHKVILTGSKADVGSCNDVYFKDDNLINLSGQQNLTELLKTLSSAQLLISNDSGAQHMAAIVGLPTVSIFGPTRLSLGYRPFNERSVVLQLSQLSCSPCGLHGQKSCPIGTHECMTHISADQVLMAAEKLLKIY